MPLHRNQSFPTSLLAFCLLTAAPSCLPPVSSASSRDGISQLPDRSQVVGDLSATPGTRHDPDPLPPGNGAPIVGGDHEIPSLDGHVGTLDSPGASALPQDQDTGLFEGDQPETVMLAPHYLDPVLPLDDETMKALANRDYARAERAIEAMDPTSIPSPAAADHSFLLAWLRIRTGDSAGAVPLLESLAGAETAPAPYKAITRAELLLADGRPVDAVQELESLTSDSTVIWPRAMMVRARALADAGRTSESRQVLQELLERPDPSAGNPEALLEMATLTGIGSDESYDLLIRLWGHYPDHADRSPVSGYLSSYAARGSRYRPGWRDKAWRADSLMNMGRYTEAISLVQSFQQQIDGPDLDSCRAWYALGRSQYRRNQLTAAAATLTPAGRECVGIDQDRGAKSLYLAGKALERKKQWGKAALVYESLAQLYPRHSMADDGLLLAGIAWQEAGDLARAIEDWTRQVQSYPTEDMAGEGFWRLAWGAYNSGDTQGALDWSGRAMQEIPLAVDATQVQAAAYWHARWLLYPDWEHPQELVGDPTSRLVGIRRLLKVCQEYPASIYAMLAAARLQELDPAALQALPSPAWDQDSSPWAIPSAQFQMPAVRNATGLARLGLWTEALAELKALSSTDMDSGIIGVFMEQMMEGEQRLQALDRLRSFLDDHPAEELERNRGRLLKLAYPSWFQEEMLEATRDHAFDYRIFQGLVREESSFNEKAQSHAGARGLSHLMPATARTVAGWMGVSVSNSRLFDALLNLSIGARYFSYLLERYKGNPFMAMAAYNAGEGNVGKWLSAHPGRPTDEFIEYIVFRETRRYVKRVSNSWQTYRLIDGEEPTFPDLSRFNHKAML